MGETRIRDSQQLAGNLLRLARRRRGLSQRMLAERAGVAQSTVARIEAHTQQPSLPLLAKVLAAADLELRTRIEDYDSHDDVLDMRRAGRSEAQNRRARRAQDRLVNTG